MSEESRWFRQFRCPGLECGIWLIVEAIPTVNAKDPTPWSAKCPQCGTRIDMDLGVATDPKTVVVRLLERRSESTTNP
jgi:hypothetical protein